eukprot:c24548_g2_i1 orf=365-3709(-)
MVELSLLHAMAGPSDPFSHQQRNPPTPNPNPNHSPWGTWEELLLGSAVLKHGADNWALVSAELQSRARASFSFTPEACRAGYHAIQLRFGADGGREGSAALRYEELRRLRVAHLKRELEQYDNSIGSLVNKIKRLQSEREESKSAIPEAGANASTEAPGGSCEPTIKVVTSTVCGTETPCSDIAMACEEAPGDGSVTPQDQQSPNPCYTVERPTLGLATSHTDGVTCAAKIPVPALLHPNSEGVPASFSKWHSGAEERVLEDASGSLSQKCNGVVECALIDGGKSHAKQEEQPVSSSNTFLSKATSKSMENDQGVVVLNNKSSGAPVGSVETEQEMGALESRTAEILMRSHDAVDSNHTAPARLMEHNNCTVTNGMSSSSLRGGHDEGPDKIPVRAEQLAFEADVSVKLGDTLQGDTSAKQDVSPSLKSVNIEDCKKVARGKVSLYTDDDVGRKSDESESLCSPRLKSSPVKRRRNYDESGPCGFDREACVQEHVDDKRMVRKALGAKNFLDTVCNLPVESADSTEGKGHKVLATKMSCQDPLAVKVKKEMLACKEEDGIVPGSGATKVVGDLSRKLNVVSHGALNSEVRNQSASSTENSLLHEVWGESAEVVNKEMKPVSKRRRLIGRDSRKRKATTFNTTGPEDVRGVADLPRQVESAVKTESMTISHEASESMHSPGGKEENDTEAWHQVERLSGDSRFEKSEVGSYVDGNEDVSPMSRRNRREPKVSGKLIPLLESLRTVCAHRCAPFFRHNQEPEENRMYYRMVRAPMDLGMIRAKLEEGQYAGSMHFFRDLLLMVNNALVYYPRDSTESAAASGLRECVVKEMGNVFETEALVKQEGPSFRKRDSRQLATANQGRRKGGLKLPSAMDKPSRDLALMQSDVSTSMESRRASHQSVAIRLDEGARADRGVDVKKNVDSPEGKRRSSDNEKTSEGSNGLKVGSTPSEKAKEAKGPGLKLGSTPSEKANEAKEPGTKLGSTPSEKANEAKEPGTKLGSTPSEKANEAKELGSSKFAVNVLSKDAKIKDRLSENGLEKKGELAKVGSTSKASASASNKGVESGGRKPKAVPDVVQEPVKRGVGRPPKHSQQQGLQKAREMVEVPSSTRKRVRR